MYSASVSHGVENISLGCGVRASLMLFLINAVILVLNCLVLIVYLYIYFLSVEHYFLYLSVIRSLHD